MHQIRKLQGTFNYYTKRPAISDDFKCSNFKNLLVFLNHQVRNTKKKDEIQEAACALFSSQWRKIKFTLENHWLKREKQKLFRGRYYWQNKDGIGEATREATTYT